MTMRLAIVLILAGFSTAAMAESPVEIRMFQFRPGHLEAKAGTKVRWINQDDIPHTVVASDRSFKSKVLDSDERFSFTFTKPGEYGYFCGLHPHMTGKVIVKAG